MVSPEEVSHHPEGNVARTPSGLAKFKLSRPDPVAVPPKPPVAGECLLPKDDQPPVAEHQQGHVVQSRIRLCLSPSRGPIVAPFADLAAKGLAPPQRTSKQPLPACVVADLPRGSLQRASSAGRVRDLRERVCGGHHGLRERGGTALSETTPSTPLLSPLVHHPPLGSWAVTAHPLAHQISPKKTSLASLRKASLLAATMQKTAGEAGGIAGLAQRLAPPYFEKPPSKPPPGPGPPAGPATPAASPKPPAVSAGSHSDWAINVLRDLSPASGDKGLKRPVSLRAEKDAAEQADSTTKGRQQPDECGKIPGAPTFAELLQRQGSRGKGLHSNEQVRVLRSGRRYRMPDSSEVSKDSVLDILAHLHFFGASEGNVLEILKGVSSSLTLTFSDVMEVVETFAERERDELLEVFEDKCGCTGNGGEMSRQSLNEILHSLGAYPPQAAINEAIQAAGLTSSFGSTTSNPPATSSSGAPGAASGATSGGVGFEEFISFLAAYRASEGLSRRELAIVHRVFLEHGRPVSSGSGGADGGNAGGGGSGGTGGARGGARLGAPGGHAAAHGLRGRSPASAGTDDGGQALRELPFAKLEVLLVAICGHYARDDITTLLGKLPSLPWQHKEGGGGLAAQPVAIAQGISLHELCIWVRRLRDTRLEQLWDDYELADIEEDGRLPVQEIAGLLKGMNLTVSLAAVHEFLEEIGESPNEPLEFDDYVRVVEVCQKHEGFPKHEREELDRTFKRFDQGGQGELSMSMVFDLLRYIYGYTLREDEAHRIMRDIDCNKNGTLSFNEFLFMMRQYRETELKRARAAYTMYSGRRQDGGLSFANLPGAIESMKLAPRKDIIQRFQGDGAATATLCFDDFVEVVECCRVDNLQELRKQASFTKEQFALIGKRFREHARNGLVLTRGQLLWLLMSIGLTLGTTEERGQVMCLLEEARTSAIEAGVNETEVGDDAGITLWVLTHLLRLLLRRGQARRQAREDAAAVEAGFSAAEVSEFREVFTKWVASHQETTAAAAGKPSQGGSDDESVSPRVAPAQSVPNLGTDSKPGRRASLPAVAGLGQVCPLLPFAGGAVTAEAEEKKQPSQSLEVLFKVSERGDRLPMVFLLEQLAATGLQPRHAQRKDLLLMAMALVGDTEGEVDFADFLRLMRWMIDSNFGGVTNHSTRTRTEPPTMKPPASPMRRHSSADGTPRMLATKSAPLVSSVVAAAGDGLGVGRAAAGASPQRAAAAVSDASPASPPAAATRGRRRSVG